MSDPLGRSDPARASGAPPASGQDPRGFSDVPRQVLGDRYVIERELDHGGMSRILLAHDRRLNRAVAIKVLLSAAASDRELQRLEREARLVGALGHPNVVEVHDIGTCEGRPFIVEERLEGRTLRQRMREGRVPTAEAIDVATQIARGLSAAHERGVVHCDVKPENVFVVRDGRVKILDFGVARLTAEAGIASAIDSATTGGRFAGTPPYSSPEQIRGGSLDARSDIFSLGCVLYEMLAGHRPFDGPSPVETAYAVLQADPEPLPPSVPAELQRIVSRCLEKDPAKRFQSAQDLAFDLEGVVEAPRDRRRWWTLGPLATAITLAVAAIAVILLVPRLPRRPEPGFRQITFLPGAVWSARFTPDGRDVLFTEAFDGGPPRVYSTRAGQPEYQRLNVQDAVLLSVSSRGETAILRQPDFRGPDYVGTLAVVPPSGGGAREILEQVDAADWMADGSALAVVRRVGGRHRLEYPSGTILFETTGWLSHPRVSPAGELIAFFHHSDLRTTKADLMVVDRRGNARTVAAAWDDATGLAWSPSGADIWFSASAADPPDAPIALRAVSLTGAQRVLSQTTGDLKLEDVSRDGVAAVTAPRRYIGVAVSDAAGERDLSVRDEQLLKDLSADGSVVLFAVNPRTPDGQGLLFVRHTDGSPPVQISSGSGGALSPDGKWALVFPRSGSPRTLSLVPTGAGEAKTLPPVSLDLTVARFFADGQRVLLVGQESGHATRLYVMSIDGGGLRPISEEGVNPWRVAVSGDGRFVAAIDPLGAIRIYPTADGVPAAVPETHAGEVPYGWTADGALLVGRALRAVIEIDRIDLRAHRRSPWRTVRPAAPGAYAVSGVLLSSNEKLLAYSYRSWKTHLYLIQGLR
jgi:eukaryotic-like serine/threonine-protein kinase